MHVFSSVNRIFFLFARLIISSSKLAMLCFYGNILTDLGFYVVIFRSKKVLIHFILL